MSNQPEYDRVIVTGSRIDYLIPGSVIDISQDGTVIRQPDGSFIQMDTPRIVPDWNKDDEAKYKDNAN